MRKHTQESHRTAEDFLVIVVGQQDLGGFIPVGDYKGGVFLPPYSQNPFRIIGDGKVSLFTGPVVQPQFNDFNGILRGDKHCHLRAYTMPAVAEAGVSPPVVNLILLVTGPERRRRP